ncbi:hypothetical protein D3C84_974520 [compost metagenome]
METPVVLPLFVVLGEIQFVAGAGIKACQLRQFTVEGRHQRNVGDGLVASISGLLGLPADVLIQSHGNQASNQRDAKSCRNEFAQTFQAHGLSCDNSPDHAPEA